MNLTDYHIQQKLSHWLILSIFLALFLGAGILAFNQTLFLPDTSFLLIMIVFLSIILALLSSAPRITVLLLLIFSIGQGLLLSAVLPLPHRDTLPFPAFLASGGITAAMALLAGVRPVVTLSKQQRNLALTALVLSLIGFLWLFPKRETIGVMLAVLLAALFGLLLYVQWVGILHPSGARPPAVMAVKGVYLLGLALFWVLITLQLMLVN